MQDSRKQRQALVCGVLAIGVLAILGTPAYPNASSGIGENAGTLVGTVTSEDGAPIPGATVTAESTGRIATAITNAVGQFRILGIAPGTYRVEASFGGYATVIREFTVTAGASSELNIVLPVAVPVTGTIRGTVKNEAGSSIAAADVTLIGPNDKERETKTDGDGSYRESGLKPGPWKIEVKATGYQSEQRTVELSEREDLEASFTLKALKAKKSK